MSEEREFVSVKSLFQVLDSLQNEAPGHVFRPEDIRVIGEKIGHKWRAEEVQAVYDHWLVHRAALLSAKLWNPSIVTPSAHGERGRARPTLRGINLFADYLGLDLRKRIKAMAGDYDVEIARLHTEGRRRAAKWNKGLAWAYAIWYVVRSPADRIAGLLVKALTGK